MRCLLLALLSLSSFGQVIGFVDVANCNTIEGWAADTSKPNQSVQITVEVMPTIKVITADLLRPDVGAFLKDNGKHGFRLSGPFYNGTYMVKVGTTVLSGGSGTFTKCGAAPPVVVPSVPATNYLTFQAGDKLDLGVGITGTKSEDRIAVMVDVTSIPLFEAWSSGACRSGALAKRGADLHYCAQGVWRKVRLE